MRELLIATTRKGKLDEIRTMLTGDSFKVLSLSDVSITDEVDEVGTTFEGNALIKAFTYGKRSGKLTMSEDSGLEIDYLGGKPGVYTAQYGEGTSDFGCQMLLDEMREVPEENRGAQYHSVIVLYDPATDKVRISEGIARGKIAHAVRGSNGFKQDPIFEFDATGKTGAEMTMQEKNEVSHRSIALKKMRQIMLTEFV